MKRTRQIYDAFMRAIKEGCVHKRIVNLSHAFHHTDPSLVSSVGCFGLRSIWEAGGAICFGVVSSSSRPPG